MSTSRVLNLGQWCSRLGVSGCVALGLAVGCSGADSESASDELVDEGALTGEVEQSVATRIPELSAPENVFAPPGDAEITDSGLASVRLLEGSGSRFPRSTEFVRVHYTGWTTDGERFDSSVARGEPSEFPLSGVIPGWTEGLQLMVEGETRRFWIPEELAYGGRSAPFGMLVFDVELLEILAG